MQHLEDHLSPSLLAAIASLVRQIVRVASSAWAGILSRQNNLNFFELKQALVHLFLQLSEGTQDNLINLPWQLEIDLWIVLGPA